MTFDKDLRSIQEVRNLVAAARAAQKVYASFSQECMDHIVEEVARACLENASKLAEMAVKETGFGRVEDKILKNRLGSIMTYDFIKGMKTVGILKDDKLNGILEIGVPVGVVAAIIPSTNPTSTVMYKALISLKSGNGIVFSPHPGAMNCISETVKIIELAAKSAGAPDGLIGCITEPTLQSSQELMKHKHIGIILATGGEAMVRAAYSSGNPALGVGPGNGPAFIHRSASVDKAVRQILDSKTFDNGTICASEQSIVTEHCIAANVEAALQSQGGYFLNDEESQKVSKLLMRGNGTMNPLIVGKSAKNIAALAGLKVPDTVRVLVSKQTEVSPQNPFSREKLCPVLGYYVEENWEQACERCIAILENEGVGHTMVIHATDDQVIREFALKKPVSRLLVNTPAALGGVGATTNLAPALTLGCGAVGKSATSDNVTPMHLINIRRVAWGTKELSDIRGNPALEPKQPEQPQPQPVNAISAEQIEAITRAVLARLNG